jgi:hypothetical protein
MADRLEFGKRRPQRLPDLQPEPAQKRSRHVVLLVMGAFAVGGGAYAMMERPNCQPMQAAPGVAAPQGAVAPAQGACTSRGSSYSGVTHSTHYGFFSGGSSGGSDSVSSSVSRGGFGSFGRAFGFASS